MPGAGAQSIFRVPAGQFANDQTSVSITSASTGAASTVTGTGKLIKTGPGTLNIGGTYRRTTLGHAGETELREGVLNAVHSTVEGGTYGNAVVCEPACGVWDGGPILRTEPVSRTEAVSRTGAVEGRLANRG